MNNGSVTIIVSAGGLTANHTFTRSASGAIAPQDKALAAAIAGTLSTRTNDTDGTLTLTAGHGITDGQVITIFWTTALGVLQCCYRATVGTVATNDVPFTGGLGDALPAQDFVISAQVETVLDVDFDGDKAELVCASLTKNGHVRFEDSGDAVLKAATLPAGEPVVWWDNSVYSTLITGNPVDQVHIANGDAVNESTFKLLGIYNSDA